MDDGLRMVQSRRCAAWALPGDPTCAGIARRLFRLVASGLAIEPEAIDDGVTMVSELAANTLHAQQRHSLHANPELWLYLRGSGSRAELVCKVFDTLPGWVRGHAPGRAVSRVPTDAVSGRGLEVVHELSSGHWGHHLSRARLAGAALRGKAVWFGLPAPASRPRHGAGRRLGGSRQRRRGDNRAGEGPRQQGLRRQAGARRRSRRRHGGLLDPQRSHRLVPVRRGLAAGAWHPRAAVGLLRPGRGRGADCLGARDNHRDGRVGHPGRRHQNPRLSLRSGPRRTGRRRARSPRSDRREPT
jgi:hypothetical protein